LNSSEFFDDRDYLLLSEYAEPKITYQPDQRFRTTIGFRFGSKKNLEGANESLEEMKLGTEVRYNSADAGLLTARFNFIRLDYTGNTNSFIAYEMLGGLSSGRNLTWNLSLLRNINSIIQVNVGYEGRKGEGKRTVHTGNVQFRAFF
jgi:hypothetical protein